MSEDVISIIIPVLNEAAALPALLETLLPFQRRADMEILTVDGGSNDGTALIAELTGFRVMTSPPGRARQMNAGAAAATGDILLFLHADTLLPDGFEALIRKALRDSRRVWGRFDVDINGEALLLPIIALFMNLRSRMTGIATGDQALFVRREAFMAVGGFPDQPLMEDIELSRRLRGLSRPACIRRRAVTSGRRWVSRGVVHTVLLMWRLRWAYWRGVSPSVLAEAYR